MTSSDQAPQIFLSYARADGRDYVQRLANDLTKPPHQYDIWWDRRDINPYQDFSAEIEIAIRDSAYVVVCITPSINYNPDSFVRREIIYAQTIKKPIIPLVFPSAIPIILINHLTWLDFKVYKTGLNELLERLKKNDEPSSEDARPDPYRPYLQALYQSIVRFIKATSFEIDPIELTSQRDPDAVASQPQTIQTAISSVFWQVAGLDPQQEPQIANDQSFSSLRDAVKAFNNQLLLLGEPGAGKTTSLFAFARDLVAERLEDASKPLPMLAPISLWPSPKGQPTPLADWLATGAGIQILSPEQIKAALITGDAFLLLDGLDELGQSRKVDDQSPKVEVYDPRPLFVEQINHSLQVTPYLPIIMTCRIKDYRAIVQKVALQGAVMLKPLSDTQLELYFERLDLPQLWQALKTDPELREVARTPLLLSLFTYIFKEATFTLLESFEGKAGNDLSNLIFAAYLEQRWQHEKLKHNKPLPMTFSTFKELLAQVAYDNFGLDRTKNRIMLNDLAEVIQENDLCGQLLELALLLHTLVPNEDSSYRFIHLKLRDNLAYQKALISLRDKNDTIRNKAAEILGIIGDPRAVKTLIQALTDDDDLVRARAVEALAQIGYSNAIPALIQALQDEYDLVHTAAAAALAKISHPRAINALREALSDKNSFVRVAVIEVLGQFEPHSDTPYIITMLHDNNL